MNNQLSNVAVKVSKNKRFRNIMAGLLILAVGIGLAIVPAESSSPFTRIRTMQDGLWWAVTTITGVGYGDLYPVTGLGRILGSILEIFGVVLFGSIVAIVSVELLRYQEDYYVRRMFKRLDEVEIKIDEMKKHLDFLVKKNTK